MAIDHEKKAEIESRHIEHIESELGAVEKVNKVDDEVASIEEAAASQAAWLISVTVSLGG
jgi:hypothetical protein